MRNKRGQLFSLWMVIMTLFLCGVSISMYNVQQDKLAVSLVSPLPVLELRDNLTVFEMEERELIKSSLDSVSSDFDSDGFVDEFKKNFISGLSVEMKDFLLRNLKLKQGASGSWDSSLEDTFFGNVVYREIEMDNGKLRFVRGKVEQSRVLSSEGDWSVVNFQVDFDYNFKREYLISKVGNNYNVEEVV